MSEHHPIPSNPRFHDLTGKRFSRLLVTGYAGGVKWHCLCDCGRTKAIYSGSLKQGKSTSCGCFHRERMAEILTTHGNSAGPWTPEYCAWAGMIQRCTNEKCKSYRNYGGRGIRVCERWLQFENFLADMGPRPPRKTLDRFPDNNGNYCPENCRWATWKEQGRNTRKSRMLTWKGETLCLPEWAERTGLHEKTIASRLNQMGWSVERALSTPIRRR